MYVLHRRYPGYGRLSRDKRHIRPHAFSWCIFHIACNLLPKQVRERWACADPRGAVRRPPIPTGNDETRLAHRDGGDEFRCTAI